MTPVLVYSRPAAVLSVGEHGPFVAPPWRAQYRGYLLEFSKGALWPASGEVLTMRCERSHDGGRTWHEDARLTFGGGPWKTRAGEEVATDWRYIAMGTDHPGTEHEVVRTTANTDSMRFMLDVHQPCDFGFSLRGVP
ncbi:MAG: hypothetical protein JSR67_03740 [Proteobacteria bacterium]|nr:hypothetical protein [Pseudomonadota bacterium]